MYYEVFIPARESEEFDTTITVEADNWMVALKSGLERTGQLGEGIRNVMCDIKDDNSIHVTDGSSRRVFVLKETQADGSDLAAVKAAEVESVKEPVKEPVKKPVEAKSISVDPSLSEPSSIEVLPTPSLEIDTASKTEPMKLSDIKEASGVSVDFQAPDKNPLSLPDIPIDGGGLEEKSYTSPDGRISIGSATYQSLQREDSEAKVIKETRAPSGIRPAVEVNVKNNSISQNILEEVFLEMQQIHEPNMEMEAVIEFVMNISMEKISAEAGSIMFADLTGTELYFAAARGPKADGVMDFRVPMGVGIVGFCVREGVSLAIGDVEKDPRFYKEISEKLGYETRNLCCVPIQHEGRVYGAIELMNKAEVFDSQEVSALTYIGKQMAKFIHDLIMAQEKIT